MSMMIRLLSSAQESGAEVVVETRTSAEGFRGRILECDGQEFTLFHSGHAGGMLWVFRVEDVACCALVLSSPHALASCPTFSPTDACNDADAPGVVPEDGCEPPHSFPC